MSDKIIDFQDLGKFSQSIHAKKNIIVLVGGCFDILHIGHITFLNTAKGFGDKLIVLLESDATISKIKGENRPIHRQEDRASILASLESVDYVVNLPVMKNDKSYDDVILKIKPAIISTTIGDENRNHKLRQAALINALLVDIPKVANYSTSKLARLLEKEI